VWRPCCPTSDEPVDAVGFSLGAMLLLRLAIEDPSRFGKLVLIGVGANAFRTEDSEALIKAFEGEAADDDVTAQLFVRFAEGAGNDPKALAACLRRPWPPLTTDDLAKVTIPVLVIMGDRDFAGPPDPLVEALPDARFVTLPGIDHFRSIREFRCIDAALDFLEATG
jgi:pimeloyl-ACP methyl ester carboxylesterase